MPHLDERGIQTEIITRAVDGWPRSEPIAGSGRAPDPARRRVAARVDGLRRGRAGPSAAPAFADRSGARARRAVAGDDRARRAAAGAAMPGHRARHRAARRPGPAGRKAARADPLADAVPVGLVRRPQRRHGAELLERGVPAGRILSLPNGVDLKVYRPADREERARLRERFGLAAGPVRSGPSSGACIRSRTSTRCSRPPRACLS